MNIQRHGKIDLNLSYSILVQKRILFWISKWSAVVEFYFSYKKIKYINSIFSILFKPQQSKYHLTISAFVNCWENVFSPALSSSTQGPMNTRELRGLETTSFLVSHAQKEDAKWGRKNIQKNDTRTRVHQNSTPLGRFQKITPGKRVIQRMSPNFDFRYIPDVAIAFPWGPAPGEITAVHLFCFTLRTDVPRILALISKQTNVYYAELLS